MVRRCLTKQEKVLHGLTTGQDAPLVVRHGGIAGRGVFATASIEKGAWLCEYKASETFPASQYSEKMAVHDLNRVEGSYIVGCQYPIPGVGKLCWDATYYPHQIGRYMNHAQRPNAELTAPVFVRDKWRIGFVATRDIGVGDEVVWDYIERSEVWSGCRLVQGEVKEKTEKRGRQTTSDAQNPVFIQVS